MKIKANLVILTVNYQNGKTYILSEDDKSISVPYLEITNDNKSTLNKDVNTKIIEYLPKVNELELIQQIVTHHNGLLDKGNDELNMVFGYLVSFVPSSESMHWIELDWRKPNELHKVLFEVAQRLK